MHFPGGSKLNRLAGRIACTVLCIWSLSGPLQAQNGSIADSVNTFMIDVNLQSFLGFGCVIVQKGEEDYTFTSGFQGNDEMAEFTDSTIFNLGPVSKLFTAMAVVILAERGALRLDDPVYYYFPEFLEIQGKSKFAPYVTVKDLLQHYGGMTQSMEHLYPELFSKEAVHTEDEYYQNTFNYRAFLNTEDFLNRFTMYAHLDARPGRKYRYSNLGYVILGYIVEQASGRNLGEFVTNEIFVPLGMNDSHYYITPDSLADRLAMGFYRMSDGSYLNVHLNEVESPSPTGDGGIKTTLRDMTLFMKFLLGDFREEAYKEVLPRSALVSMTGPLTKGPDKETYVGLGFHNLQPWNLTGHAGSWDGFLNILYYHPETHSCVFLTTNREDNELYSFFRVYVAYALLFQQFRPASARTDEESGE